MSKPGTLHYLPYCNPDTYKDPWEVELGSLGYEIWILKLKKNIRENGRGQVIKVLGWGDDLCDGQGADDIVQEWLPWPDPK